MDIHKLYAVISQELKQLVFAEDQAAKTLCLRNIESAMDQYKAIQSINDFNSLQGLLSADGIHTTRLLEPDDVNSEGIAIFGQEIEPLKLFFDNVTTVTLARDVLLEEGLSSPKDDD